MAERAGVEAHRAAIGRRFGDDLAGPGHGSAAAGAERSRGCLRPPVVCARTTRRRAPVATPAQGGRAGTVRGVRRRRGNPLQGRGRHKVRQFGVGALEGPGTEIGRLLGGDGRARAVVPAGPAPVTEGHKCWKTQETSGLITHDSWCRTRRLGAVRGRDVQPVDPGGLLGGRTPLGAAVVHRTRQEVHARAETGTGVHRSPNLLVRIVRTSTRGRRVGSASASPTAPSDSKR
jgi:hypothetical protein